MIILAYHEDKVCDDDDLKRKYTTLFESQDSDLFIMGYFILTFKTMRRIVKNSKSTNNYKELKHTFGFNC